MERKSQEKNERTTPVPDIYKRNKVSKQKRQEIRRENINPEVDKFKAGTVAENLEFWKSITSDRIILQAVQGYKLEFEEEPKSLFNNKIQQNFNKSDSKVLNEEIQKLLALRVILPVNFEENQILSPIFLTNNKDGTKRLILNLKGLNKFMTYEHF